MSHRAMWAIVLAAVWACNLVFWSPSLPSAEAAECSSIAKEGIEKQLNLEASEILVECGVLPAGAGTGESESPASGPEGSFPGSDVNVITGAETYPHVTQSESFVWSHGNTIVVTYNDSRGATESPTNLSGVSVSHDGGETFTRLLPSPFTGHRRNRGDPVVVYNEKLGKWFAGFLVAEEGTGSCGAKGMGMWTSTNGDTWTVGACAHIGSNDDRESMWVDNNPASPFYGRMYISFNDFSVGGGALEVVHSDDGVTWSAPVTLLSTFRRNVQVTGSPGSDGTVFVVGQEENGGGVGNTGQRNYMYRSTDGGVTWTSTAMGSTFTIPGSKSCGYFPAIPPIWRQTGWGQPAVGPNGVVQYVYAAHGEGTDESDIYYVRSTDNGATWSTPLRLNTDSSGKAQWMPSLRVTPSGVVEATWYDRRNTTNGENYQRFARVSNDNGATWGTDEPLSTEMIPQPTQPDPNVQTCYAGDYNYTTASSTTGFDTWTDGRVSIEPAGPVQKVFFHSIPLAAGPSVTTGTATGITATEAILHGTVNPNGLPTSDQFEYGTTTAYGNVVPAEAESAGSGTTVVAKGYVLTGLLPSTTYHFRIKATSSATSLGKDATFTTSSLTPAFSSNFGSTGSGNGQFVEPTGIAVNPLNGNLVVPDEGHNRVEVFNEKGEYLSQFGSVGTGNGQFTSPRGAAVDLKGNIWIIDTGNNRVEKFNEKGEYLSQFGTKGTGNGQFTTPKNLAVDSKGNVWVADSGNKRVEKFNEKGEYVCQFSAGTNPIGVFADTKGNIWSDNENETGAIEEHNESCGFVTSFVKRGSESGQVLEPKRLAVDANGYIWVPDAANNRVQVFNSKGEFVTKFGSFGSGTEQMNYPVGVAVDPRGNIWIDDNNNRIDHWKIASPWPPTFSSNFGSSGTGNGQFNQPTGIAVNPMNGNLVVPDEGNNRVQIFSEGGTYLSQFGSFGTGNGQFNQPRGAAVDSKGNIWVVDTGNNRVEKFNEKGEYLSQFGTKGTGNGQFTTPKNLAVDSKGNVWVADSGNKRVEKFNEKGEYVLQFSAGTNPIGVAVDASGNVWSDNENETGAIEEHNEKGEFVKSFATRGSGNGQVFEPKRLAIDANGSIWVPDALNNRVEVFNERGEYVTKFGSFGSGSEQMNYPVGVGVDLKGNVWIDDNNNRIDHWIR
jgi:DNA-binding beta-propeller fold protein YncE